MVIPFFISDPNVEVIYIWPWQLNEDTEKYYMKFLDMVDRKDDDGEPPSKRCTIISPDAATWFPVKHFTFNFSWIKLLCDFSSFLYL